MSRITGPEFHDLLIKITERFEITQGEFGELFDKGDRTIRRYSQVGKEGRKVPVELQLWMELMLEWPDAYKWLKRKNLFVKLQKPKEKAYIEEESNVSDEEE